MGKMLKAFGLSAPQYNALRIVAGAGRSGILSEDVGKRLVALAPDTTRLVDRLTDAGLVDRRPLAADRRCKVLTITQAGRALLRKIEPHVTRMHREQLGHLSERQLQQLSRLLFDARHP